MQHHFNVVLYYYLVAEPRSDQSLPRDSPFSTQTQIQSVGGLRLCLPVTGEAAVATAKEAEHAEYSSGPYWCSLKVYHRGTTGCSRQ